MQKNHDNSPDYSQYTIEELEDVIANIDKAQFPERFDNATKALSEKRKAQPEQPQNDDEEIAPLPPLTWSQQHIVTRAMMLSLFTLALSGVVGMFTDFMVAKSWSNNTVGLFWLLSISLIALWFACLAIDEKFAKRLTSNWRGTLALIVMPLVFLMFSWIFVDKTLPFGLHMVADQQNVRVNMDYKKRNGRKHCRHRIEIIETDKLENNDMCLAKQERNNLAEKGTLLIIGTQSRFGLHIHDFTPTKQKR